MKLINKLKTIVYRQVRLRGYKHIAQTAYIRRNVTVYNKDNLEMEDYTNINPGAIIMNTNAKFIMKKYSGAAIGLTVITGNHMSVIGMNFKQVTDKVKEQYDPNRTLDKDVIVGEDVWIASNVTLLSGVKLGRGGIIGAGSVVRMNTPPYAIVNGNPAKVVGFRFTPEEIIEHEKIQYAEDDRLPLETLQKNYDKYFLKRIKEIKNFVKI